MRRTSAAPMLHEAADAHRYRHDPRRDFAMATAGIDVGGTSARARAGAPPDAGFYEDSVTIWTGWIGFAATMLILIGSFHAIAGFVGIFKDGYYAVPRRDLLVTV